MIFRVPSYYKKFRCIADKCQDSCCIGWEIDIDEDTYSYYRHVEGAFGERLRAHMVTEEACSSFVLEENGWCPFLNEKKLCDICIALGEEALSEVCTEFPRFTMEYENVREKILSVSCEEVGRLIFSSRKKIAWEEWELPGGCDDGDAGASGLEQVRKRAVAILQDRSKPVFARAAEYLAYCDRMQRELYGGACQNETFGDGKACQGKAVMAGGVCQGEASADKPEAGAAGNGDAGVKSRAYRDFLARLKRFGRLEVLDETWTQVCGALQETFSEENYLRSQDEFLKAVKDREYEYEHLLVYFTYRYFMRAYYDDNIRTKAQFAVASVLMIRDMDVLRYLQNGGSFALCDRIDTARIFSKEVEHSEENMELLAEDFQFEEVFRVERMIEQTSPGVELEWE